MQIQVSDTDGFNLPVHEKIFEYGSGQNKGGKQACQYTQAKGDGKAFHRSSTELKQHQGRDQRGDVCIEDGERGPAVASVHGGTGCFTQGHLLPDAFKYQHIGIHGHTDRQDDAGDAGKG